jgi:uncharacterized Rmd1/YagE family protein
MYYSLYRTGCTVFWGLSRAEEQAHLKALGPYSVGPVKQVEVEDMDYTYGDTTRSHTVFQPEVLHDYDNIGSTTKTFFRVVNDAITLSSNRASEKLAISFAMAQSAKLDVFEERVEETIQKTKHIPKMLATEGVIPYSQLDISKLIGRLFIEVSLFDLNIKKLYSVLTFVWLCSVMMST